MRGLNTGGETSSAWDVKNYLTVKCFWLSVALSQVSGRTIEMKDSPLTGAIHLRRGEIFPMCFGSDFVSHRRFSFSTVFRSIELGRRDGGGQFLDSPCFSRGEDRSKNQRLCFQWRGRLFEVESSHFVFLVLWYLPRASRRKRIGDLISSLLTLAPKRKSWVNQMMKKVSELTERTWGDTPRSLEWQKVSVVLIFQL